MQGMNSSTQGGSSNMQGSSSTKSKSGARLQVPTVDSSSGQMNASFKGGIDKDDNQTLCGNSTQIVYLSLMDAGVSGSTTAKRNL